MNSKRKTRANTTRGVRTKGTPEKNIPIDGVYGNARFMHSGASLVGCVVQLQVKNGGIYEGIFRTFSHKFDVVLEMVHKVEEISDSHPAPAKESLYEKFIFHAVDIVSIIVKNVDLAFPTKDSFATDAAISKFNGQINSERELEPWESEDAEELISLEAENANGWDPDDMFRTNAEQYGVTSSYDGTLSGYTTPLNPKNTKEYQKREAEAQKLAQEIENSAIHKSRSELENGDEEERFSAVIRPNENSSNVGKYVPPPKRKGLQSGKLRRSSPSPQSSNSAISPVRCHTRSSPPVILDTSIDPKINGENCCEDDRKFDDNDSRASGDLSSRGNDNNTALVSEKDASPLANIIDRKNSSPKAREEEIAELKEFSSNFKLTEDNEKDKDIDETPCMEQSESVDKLDTDLEKASSSLKTFTLNPNAKEFVLNPNAKAFTPRNPGPQTPTPPRPQTQSPVMPPPQATQAVMPSPIYTTITPQYVMSPTQMNVSMAHPFNMATMQQAPRGFRKTKVLYKSLSICLEAVPMSVQARPPELVAAATGQPLLAPGSIQQHQFVQYTPQGVVHGHGVQHPMTYPQMYPMARMVAPQGMTMVPASHNPGSYQDTQHPTQVYGELLHYTVSPPPGAGMPTHMTPPGHHPTMHVSGHPQSSAGQQNQINMSQQAMHPGQNQVQTHGGHNSNHPTPGSQPTMIYSAHSQMGQPGLHPNPHTPTSPQSLHPTPVTHSHTTPHMQPTSHASNPHTHVTQGQTHSIPTSHGHQSLVLVSQQAPAHLSGHPQVPGHQLQGHPIQGPHHVPGQPHPVLPHSSVSTMPVTSTGNVAPTHYIPHPQVGHSHPQPPVQNFHHPQ